MRVGILTAALILFSSGVVQAVFIDFGIVKVAEYFQTDTNTVVLDTEVPYEFFAFYEESVEETVISVKILDSSGITVLRTLTEFAPDGIWELEEDFMNIDALNEEWPNDLYHMEITTDLSGGPFTVPLDFGVSDAYFPELPQFSNIGISSGLLEFDFTQSFTLSWNKPSDFVNGIDHLFLFVEVFDGAEEIEEIIELETDTFQDSFFIAGGTLNLDKNYEAGLIFFNVVDTDTASISGKTGVAGFASITIFDIAHVPEPRTYGFLLGLAALGFVILRRRVQ